MITEAGPAPTLCAAVVVHHSCLARLDATLDCLAGALRRAVADGSLGGAQVIVYDNASDAKYRDDLAAALRARAADYTAPLDLRWSCAASNAGYGAGVNAAVALCGPGFDTGVAAGAAMDAGNPPRRCDYLLILNPDVELDPDALAVALRYLSQHAEVTCLAPRCRRPSGDPEYLCKRYPAVLDLLLRGSGSATLRRLFATRLARYEYRDLDPDVPAAVVLASGACMLTRCADFARVDGFDTNFFMYFEDFDLSLRLARRGPVMFLPAMTAVHHGGNAARKGGRHIRWFVASALRFYRLHGWRWF